MNECLQGLRIALLAADGVGEAELEGSGEAVRQAGAQTRLLSLQTGHIESVGHDLGTGRSYTVDHTVAESTVDEYEALLLLPGPMKFGRLSSDDGVVSFVLDFITSGKPVGIVCYGAWTLLEAGVARGQCLPLSATMRAPRPTDSSVLRGELVSPREQRAFYSTIVREFARITRQPSPQAADESEHAWAQLAALPPRPVCEKNCATAKLARGYAASSAMSW